VEPYSDVRRVSATPGRTTAVQVDADEVCRLTTALACWAALFDSLSTYVGVGWLGTREGSRAVAWMIDAVGIGPAMTLRTVIILLLIGVCWRAPVALRLAGLTWVAAIHLAVVAHNITVMGLL
jgi:hypothetical protein